MFEILDSDWLCDEVTSITTDVITLGTCFSMFVYIRGCFRFVVIDGNLTAQLMGNHRGIGRGIQN